MNPPPINPHVWRKFSQAQRNMRRFSFLYLRRQPRYSDKLYRRFKKWGNEFDKWLKILLKHKPKQNDL